MDDNLARQSIGFFSIPQEMRRLIINTVDKVTRAKLAQCSTNCDKEVRNFYIDNIEIFNFGNQAGVVLYIGHRQDRLDYTLSCERTSENTIQVVKTRLSDGFVFLRDPVVTQLSIYEYSLNYVKNYMVSFGSGIRKLSVQGDHLDWNWAELPRFRHLEELEARDTETAADILPKTNDLLSHLTTSSEEIEEYSDRLANEAQFYTVGNTLNLPRTVLNDEQLVCVIAKCIYVHRGLITPNGMINFINQWRNGDRNEHVILQLSWSLFDNFDSATVFFAFETEFIEAHLPALQLCQHLPNQGVADLSLGFSGNNVTLTFSTV